MAGLTAEQLFIKQINLFILKYAAFTLNFPLKDLYSVITFPTMWVKWIEFECNKNIPEIQICGFCSSASGLKVTTS